MFCRIPHRHWLQTYRPQRYITDCINDGWLSFLIGFIIQKGADVAASILGGSGRMIFIVTHVDSMASHFATYRLASLRHWMRELCWFFKYLAADWFLRAIFILYPKSDSTSIDFCQNPTPIRPNLCIQNTLFLYAYLLFYTLQ